MKPRELLPVSDETMKAIWQFFLKTSIPRIVEEEKRKQDEQRKEQ